MPSKLEQLQLQFRQRLKEEQMIKIHTENQQKALHQVSKYNNGIYNGQSHFTLQKATSTIQPQPGHHSPIKKGSPGVDRSRPLPPIANRNTSSTRNSPTENSVPVRNTSISTRNSPTENAVPVSGTTELRSKSVDSGSRPIQNGRMVSPRQIPNGRVMQQKNGYHKPASSDLRQPNHYEVPIEKRTEQETMYSVKQAELQRFKANTKAREDTSPRNGFNGTASKSVNGGTFTKPYMNGNVAKSSYEPKRVNKSPTPAVTAQRPKPQAPSARKTSSNRPSGPPSQNGSSHQALRKPPGPGQKQCGICGRNFNDDRIEKHTSICKKMSQKKTKVFDATKMRVKGTEAEQFVRKGLPKTEPKLAKKADWRKKHNDFIETIRQAKLVQQHLARGGKVSDLPPPPPSDTSDYLPCPHCGRRFSEAVAERHIPKCQNILSNKKAPPRRK